MNVFAATRLSPKSDSLRQTTLTVKQCSVVAQGTCDEGMRTDQQPHSTTRKVSRRLIGKRKVTGHHTDQKTDAVAPVGNTQTFKQEAGNHPRK